MTTAHLYTMSFLANESPPSAQDEPAVTNDGWFPDLEPATIRAEARLDGTVTPARLRGALLTAMAHVNAELFAYQAEQIAQGVSALSELPGPQLGGESVACVHYRNAVVSHLQADLAERYRDFDTTGTGDKKAEELTSTADSHRRNLRWAIAALCGRPNTTVELI